jgi:SAM-dependent methyltransferase
MPAVLAAPPVVPADSDVQTELPLCCLANPRFEQNAEWRAMATDIYTGVPDDEPDALLRLYAPEGVTNRRKLWETTHLAYGLNALGLLDGTHIGLGVACGTEPLIYHFARHTRHLFVSDRYGMGWKCAPFKMLTRPEKFAPYPYPADRLTVLQMDASALLLPDNSLDFVYSVGSLAHFGGTKAALVHLREAARVLKPNGVLAFSTELIIYGGTGSVAPEAADFFNRTTLEWLLVNSGMERVAPIDVTPNRDLLENPAALRLPEGTAPPEHNDRMSSRVRDTIFTSVTVFLRKKI